jgi:bifunctional UDP-N-acetylglucosamine pyrophosphorylase/glucosamine-1-phosphate N-acetyltransferase
MNPTVIILAGGLGKRMGSDVPKVLHLVGGVPMIVRILRSLPANVRILIVVGKYKDIIQSTIREYTDADVEYVVQDPPLGTGHAIACCLPHIDPERQVIVLSGDVPLIKTETILKMSYGAPDLRVLTMRADDPTGYGRIITRRNIHDGCMNDRCMNDRNIHDVPQFVKIVEHKDCTEEERACTTVNCGIYAFSGKVAHQFVPLIQNINAQGQYYLTDIVGLAHGAGIRVEVCHMNDDERHTVRGVNNLSELAEIERYL